MRLGQLARKVSLKPKELIVFLENHDINGYTHANSKMSDEDEGFVLKHFGQEDTEPEPEPDPSSEPENETSIQEVENQEVAEESIEATTSEDTDLEPLDEISKDEPEVANEEEEIELIKAPKIELQGLKVVGKIDLPDPPKKKEEKLDENESEHEQRRKREPRDRNGRRRKEKKHDPDYNPIAAKRERERKKKERQAQQQKQKLKKAKTEYYLSRVSEQQAKPETQKKVHKPASYSEVALKNDEMEKANKKSSSNIFSRFWRWLNTY